MLYQQLTSFVEMLCIFKTFNRKLSASTASTLRMLKRRVRLLRQFASEGNEGVGIELEMQCSEGPLYCAIVKSSDDSGAGILVHFDAEGLHARIRYESPLHALEAAIASGYEKRVFGVMDRFALSAAWCIQTQYRDLAKEYAGREITAREFAIAMLALDKVAPLLDDVTEDDIR